MCGITGVIGAARPEAMEAMLRSTSHRGEDSRAFHGFDRFGALGINRLSIVDLERGDQPLFNEDGSLALVCNGEIYNHAATYESKRREYAPWNIQSKEMLHYFEIWRSHFAELLEPGKTFDDYGDYPVLMDQISSRGERASSEAAPGALEE